MEDPQVLGYGLLAALSFMYLYTLLMGDKLKHIPAIGYTTPILSYYGAYKALFNNRELVLEGYRKYKDGAFRIASFNKWDVVVTGTQMIEELRKAPDDALSLMEAVNQKISMKYTLGPNVNDDTYHIPIVRTTLTRNIAAIFDDIRDEISTAFSDTVPLKGDEWLSVPALGTIMQVICRTSNRAFVGLPKCRDADYCALNIQFTIDVVKASVIIGLFPEFLKPLAGRLFTNVPPSIARGMRHLAPIIEERRKKLETYGPEWADKPNDFLAWLMDEAKGYELTTRALVLRLLTLNFAAIHTSSMSFTHALFYLATYPEYAKPLREEVDAVVKEEGWSKAAMGKMHKVDSFLRESQRITGAAILSMGRIALKDFTFSNGTFIPKGTLVSVPAMATHHDEAHYVQPDVFMPWRFVDMRSDQTGGSLKYQMVTTSTEYVPFGHGRHACPGRFFAASELKAMLAHIVMTYDVKLEEEAQGQRPANLYFGTSVVPNTTAKVMFRKRY